MVLKSKRRKKVTMIAVLMGLAITCTAGLTACAKGNKTSDMPAESESVNEISADAGKNEPMTDGMWLNK